MPRLKVKRTVRPRALVIAAAAINIALDLDLPCDILITSGADSQHGPGSRHPFGDALDLRTKTFPDAATKERFRRLLVERLGQFAYQAILEDAGGANEHLHVEYDPRP